MYHKYLAVVMLCALALCGQSSVAHAACGDMLLLHVGGGCSGGGTTPTLVNSCSGTGFVGGGNTNQPCSSTVNVTTGNLLVVGCWADSAGVTINAPTDTASNTFTAAGSAITGYDGGGNGNLALFYAKNVTGNASDTVNCNMSASGHGLDILVIQYSGTNTSAPLDQTQNGTAVGSTSVTSGSFTTTFAREIIVCLAEGNQGGASAGSGFTSEVTIRDDIMEDKALASTATTTCSANFTSGNNGIVVATFKGT